MAASNPPAERATIDVHVVLHLEVGVRGKPKVTIGDAHASDVILTRPATKTELPAGQDDPWFEGGVAFLDETRARNGRGLADKARACADEVLLELKKVTKR